MTAERPATWDARVVWGVFALALALRLGFSFTQQSDRLYLPDSGRYHNAAQNLLEGRGLATDKNYPFAGLKDHPKSQQYRAHVQPGYPILMAAMYAVFGVGNVLALRVLQSILGALTALLLLKAGTRLGDRRIGLVAGLFAAFDPWLIFFAGRALTEVPAAFLLAGSLWCVLDGREAPRWRHGIGLGVCLGLLSLVRIEFLLLGPFLAAAWILCSPERRRAAACSGIALALVAVLMLPWVLRNAAVLGRPVLTTTRGGIALFEAFSPGADGGIHPDAPWPEELAELNELERDDLLRARARQFMMEDMRRSILLAFRKLGHTWNPVLNAVEYKRWHRDAASAVGLLVPLLFAFLGVVMRRDQWRLWLVPCVPAVYISLVHSVFIGSIRYRVPAMTGVFLVAAVGVVWAVDRFRRRRAR